MSSESKNTLTSSLKFIAKFSLSFLIIGYMVYSGRLDLNTVKKGFMDPWVVGSSLALICIGSVVAIFRWKLLLQAQGVVLTFGQALRYGFIGVFFNTTMPGAVSGDVVKAWYLLSDSPKGQTKTPIFTSIIIDRVIGLFGLVTVSMISMLIHWSTVWGDQKMHTLAIFNITMALIFSSFFLFVSFAEWGPFAWVRRQMDHYRENRLGKVVLKAYDAWVAYRKSPQILWGSVIFAAITHSCIVLSILFCARALGEGQMQAYQIFLLAPIGLLTIALPIAPSGLGVGHVAFNALFLIVGSKLGAEIFTLFVTLQILVNLSGVFFYMKSPRPLEVAA